MKTDCHMDDKPGGFQCNAEEGEDMVGITYSAMWTTIKTTLRSSVTLRFLEAQCLVLGRECANRPSFTKFYVQATAFYLQSMSGFEAD